MYNNLIHDAFFLCLSRSINVLYVYTCVYLSFKYPKLKFYTILINFLTGIHQYLIGIKNRRVQYYIFSYIFIAEGYRKIRNILFAKIVALDDEVQSLHCGDDTTPSNRSHLLFPISFKIFFNFF